MVKPMSSLPLQVALLTTCSLVVVSSCGSVETDKVRDAKQERVAYRGPAPQRDLPTIKDKSVEAKPFVQKSDQQCRHDYRTMAQLDVTCIALRPRSEVFKIIERPDPLYMDEHPKGPAYDHYWFGWV